MNSVDGTTNIDLDGHSEGPIETSATKFDHLDINQVKSFIEEVEAIVPAYNDDSPEVLWAFLSRLPKTGTSFGITLAKTRLLKYFVKQSVKESTDHTYLQITPVLRGEYFQTII